MKRLGASPGGSSHETPTRSPALLAAFVVAIFGPGCRRDTPEGTGTIMRDAGMSGRTDSKHGSHWKIIVNGRGAPRIWREGKSAAFTTRWPTGGHC